MSKRSQKLLTEVELELMTILWKIGHGSVNDVLEKLPKQRKLAYTSVSTILRILEQKKILESRKEGRGHVYVPILSKAEYEALSISNLVSKVFDGEPAQAVKRLIDTSDLTSAELKELRRILDESEKGAR